MDYTNFIFACLAFASFGFAGFALYRCWKTHDRSLIEKVVFTFLIALCPFLGAMIFFRAQESREKVDRSLRFRPGTGRGEDRTGDRPEKSPSRPERFGEKSGLEVPTKREWKSHPRQK